METFNNTTKVVRDDLAKKIKSGSKLSIAAACFSIYAYQALKEELESCDELRLFLPPRLLLQKRHRKNAGNFTSRGCSARKAFMGRNSKYV